MDILIQEISKFLPAGQVLSLILLVWILSKLNDLMTVMTELKTWRIEHEKQDDWRFKQIEEWINRHGEG